MATWLLNRLRDLFGRRFEITSDNMEKNTPQDQTTPISGTRPTLYALLIGIDRYQAPVSPLGGCVNDIEAVAHYLKEEQGHRFDMQIEKLLDENATRQNIIRGIQEHLNQAGPNDVAFLYYSGHGAQEEADRQIWTYEPDGLLEGLVCYDSIPSAAGPFLLLADKELRFLLHQATQKPEGSPHLVTIFDCCHSGDNTRNIFLTSAPAHPVPRAYRPTGRLSAGLPMRQWQDFVFANAIDFGALVNRSINEVLPQVTGIQIAACNNDESSFEIHGSGVFTKNFLEVLRRSRGQISYYDLKNRLKFFIKNQFRQTPQIYATGRDKSMLYQHFLAGSGPNAALAGNVVNNPELGWVMDMGVIQGISPQTESVEIYPTDKPDDKMTARVKAVRSNHTVLDFDPSGPGGRLYKGVARQFLSASTGIYLRPTLEMADAETLSRELPASGFQLFLVEQEHQADYCLGMVEGYFVITRPGDPARPLVYPIDNGEVQASKQVILQLQHIAQYEYAKQLHNDGHNRLPLEAVRVEFFGWDPTLGDWAVLDVQDDVLKMPFEAHPHNGAPYSNRIRIKITNMAPYSIRVAFLYLSPYFGVHSELLSRQVETLEGRAAGQETGGQVWAFDGDDVMLTYDRYVEIFNHPQAEFYFQLIASRQDFDVDLLKQGPLPDPALLVDTRRGEISRGIGRGPSAVAQDAWQTRLYTVQMPNPRFNNITAKDLEERLQTEAGPFLYPLYLTFGAPFGGVFQVRPEIKVVTVYPADSPSAPDTRGIGDFTLNIANNWSRRSRHRRYRQALKRNPDWVKIVSEGDSWFQYPDPRVRDIIDHLLKYHAIYSLGAGGDKLEAYFLEGEYLQALRTEQPRILLLSGGGNDFLGEQFLQYLHLQAPEKPEGTEPGRFFKPNFLEKLDDLKKIYQQIFEQTPQIVAGIQVIVHGYDHIIPGDDPDKGWIGRYLLAAGIDRPGDRKAITDWAIDRFNMVLQEAAQPYDHVHYIDLRGTVPDQLWWDEIHPSSQGFLAVSTKIQQLINRLTKS